MATYKYTHIIWDWNGTLINDLWLSVETINAILAKRNLPQQTHDSYRNIFGFPIKDYYQRLGFDFETDPFAVVGTEFIKEYNSRILECQLHKSATQTLATLKQMGIQSAILSAREYKHLELELSHYKLDKQLVAFTGLNNHYANSKLDIGKQLLSKLDAKSPKCLMIGDTLHDAEVATELKMDCVLFTGGHQSEQTLASCGCNIINSLSELIDLVKY